MASLTNVTCRLAIFPGPSTTSTPFGGSKFTLSRQGFTLTNRFGLVKIRIIGGQGEVATIILGTLRVASFFTLGNYHWVELIIGLAFAEAT